MLVHVRVIKEGETWIAQCLEYDITGHGNDSIKALANFRETMEGQIAVTGLDDIRPAPFTLLVRY